MKYFIASQHGIISSLRRILNSMFTEIYNDMATILEEVTEIKKHHHNVEDWFGLAAVPAGETHRADDLTDGQVNPFQVDAGNVIWGAWVQILGSSDTPNRTGKTKFDLHRVQFVDSGATNIHSFLQVGWGATGAAALTADQYSTVAYLTPTNQAAESPSEIIMPRIDSGTKVWARCLAVGENTMTLDFYFGFHEYDE